MHLQRLYGSERVCCLNVCADFGITVPFLLRIALIFEMPLTITKRACPQHSSNAQPACSLSISPKSFILSKVFPNTNFDSPLDLSAARSTLPCTLETSHIMGSSLPCVVQICRSAPGAAETIDLVQNKFTQTGLQPPY